MTKVVRVRFDRNSPKTYDYLTDLPLALGDLVAVPTGYPWQAGSDVLHKVGLAVVVGFKEHSDKAQAWVMVKIDLTNFQKQMEARELAAMLS